ncbi:hypothetical protein [Microbacterium hydrocarbonoxydans]|uniref:hypothetical protein n=1 Tax=Microbacterium hydrocarbonoxydans TaxID=273678 RepID=UPI0013DA0D6E|nr:hypothetical protein [Microbacterium hydrocarbonoxydans]
MILSFILFMIMFLGGIGMMGIAHELPDFQALVFVGGLLLMCLSLAYMMRAGRDGATRRSNSWGGKATE